MNNNKFVLFIDVLGFSQLAKNNTSEQLRQIYDTEIHKTTAACTLISAALSGGLKDTKVTTSNANKLHDVQQNNINLHIMSDSIIAWTNNTEFNSFVKLCHFTTIYLSMTLALGLPHRGAISVGDVGVSELLLNGNVQRNVIGSGIINAHNYEGSQEWMGCVVDSECNKHLRDVDIDSFSSEINSPVMKYSPPYKEGAKYTSNYVINWPLFEAPLKSEKSFFDEQFQRHNKGISDSSILKVNNTYEFYLHSNRVKKS